jgi:hypothetical protein
MKAKQTNRFSKALGRSRTVRTLVGIPSILRGLNRANTWRDYSLQGNGVSNEAELGPRDAPNPLRAYFESVTDGRGIWKWKHYFEIYHRHFQKFVGKEVRVVEIGIFSGGSLAMWKTYFGAQSLIYGIDLRSECRAYEDERTKVFVGDQGDRDFWRNFREQVQDIDVVIDDGGHLPEQQIVTLEETVPYLRPGGVYLCEDIHGSNNRFASYVHGLTSALNSFALMDTTKPEGVDSIVAASALQRSIGSVHTYPFLTVVEKTAHPVEQLLALKRGTQWQPL